MKVTGLKNIIFFTLLMLIVIGCFFLGIWQIDRYSQKKQLLSESVIESEIEVTELLAVQDKSMRINSNLHIQGSFLPDSVIKLDNRMHNSTYGVEVFSLFREKTSNTVFLVNMGWFEIGNTRSRLKQEFDFSGISELYVKVAAIPSRPPFVSDTQFRDEKQQDLWVYINRDYLIQSLGVDIEDIMLANLRPQDDLIYRKVEREDDSYMHILYAIQWFLFSAFALFGLIKIYR